MGIIGNKSNKHSKGGLKFRALLLAALLGMTAFGAYPWSGCVLAEEAGEEMEISEEELGSMMEGTIRPSDYTFPTQDKYEYPFMGMNAVLPKGLMEKMDKKEVAMLSSEAWTMDYSAPLYGFMSWNIMTEEQRDAEVDKAGTGYYDWVDSLQRIGTLGMYRKDQTGTLDALTDCTEHIELGETADGNYKYYLSINTDCDGALTDELREIQTEFTELTQWQGISVFEQPYEAPEYSDSVGEFTTQDVQGETYTEEIFQENELTMVNIFTTWCSPCINEIPELEKLHQEMADKGVGVVGIVLDSVDEEGNPFAEAVEKAKILAEKTGATYPFLMPDAGMLNGRLKGIQAVPETFFVDKEGNIVGQTYSGSADFEGWKKTVETELANLKGEQ